jgi:hypothetical protein
VTASSCALPIAKVSRPDPKIRVDPFTIEALVAPLPAELVYRSLRRQPELAAPAKLVLSDLGEAGILAEIPRNGALYDGEQHARDGVEQALSWLDGTGLASPSCAGAAESTRLQETVASLPWTCERDEKGAYEVRVAEDCIQARVRIELSGGRFSRVTTSSAVPAASSDSDAALLIFALETSRRLRLVRLSVDESGSGARRVVWDVVLPLAICGDVLLTEAVSSLVGARAATTPALRALGDPEVARAYLELRRPELSLRPVG